MITAPPSPGRTLEQALAAVADVHGWMTPDQLSVLYDGAAACPEGGQIVEIGSFHGRSTIVLASAADPTVEIIAIDPHAGNDRGPQEIDGFATESDDDHTTFNKNLAEAGLIDRVRHLRMPSNDAHSEVVGQVDVLHIDGAHRFTAAHADIAWWGGRVADGGTMLIHDAFSSVGVTLAIVRELVLGRTCRYVGRTRSMAVYRADLDGTPSERARNAARQLAQLPWFMRNIALKVLLTVGLGRVMAKVGRTSPDWPY